MHLTETHKLLQREPQREREWKRVEESKEEECDGIRFQWENEFKHFITGRFLLKCKYCLGISKVKRCVCAW